MKGVYRVRLVLTAATVLSLSTGRLDAGDLYNKEPAKSDSVALPKPMEVQSFVAYPSKISLKGAMTPSN